MAEDEKLKQRLELKVKKRDYTGYDDDEFQGGNQGLLKRSILAKYDEEIDGSQQSVRDFHKLLFLLLINRLADVQVRQLFCFSESTQTRS